MKMNGLNSSLLIGAIVSSAVFLAYGNGYIRGAKKQYAISHYHKP